MAGERHEHGMLCVNRPLDSLRLTHAKRLMSWGELQRGKYICNARGTKSEQLLKESLQRFFLVYGRKLNTDQNVARRQMRSILRSTECQEAHLAFFLVK